MPTHAFGEVKTSKKLIIDLNSIYIIHILVHWNPLKNMIKNMNKTLRIVNSVSS
jgi:hypothetical protein